MRPILLIAGFLSIMIIITSVSAAMNGHQSLKKLDSSLLTKLKEPGEENLKVIVWVDKERFGKQGISGIGKINKDFSIIPAIAMEVPKSRLQELASREFVKNIVIDRKVIALRNNAIPITRSDLAMNSFGYNGTNIKIAIIDTGIYNHTEFQSPNRIVMQQCFTQGDCPPNNANSGTNSTDDNGHGTHVTGIAAGMGSASYGRGSAPNATIMAIKVLNSAGSGLDSDVISGIEWAVDNGANIISMSLGSETPPADCYGDATSSAVDNATSRGVVVIVAAGNSGPSSSTTVSPGCAKTAITVGATGKDDKIASYSSRGPTNDNRTKPDLVATGGSGSTCPGTTIVSTYPTYLDSSGYRCVTGTSMATPLVSGIAAMVMEKYNQTFGYMPEPGRVKAILLNSVNISNMTLDGYSQRNNVYGAGRIDAYEALDTLNNSWNDSITSDSQKHRDIQVSSPSLKVTLVWMENSTTRNHLGLIVSNRTNNFTNPTDNNDTVEQVFLSNINNGTWTIYVNGTIVAGSQQYFLMHSANQIVFPIFSNNITGKNSGVQYAPQENYTFQIRVNGSSSPNQISSVIFELNNTNHTANSFFHVFNDSSGNFWINITDLSAGIYSYQWFANSSQNNWNFTQPLIFIISKNYSSAFINLTINGTNEDASFPYDSITNITAWKTFSEGNLTLYKNNSVAGKDGINQPNETLVLGGGIYNYTLVFPETQNYSFVNTSRTLTITRRVTNTTLLINGTLGNFVYNLSQIANFTAYINITGKNITLTSNMSGWIDQNSTNAIYNLTLLSAVGIFNMTAYFAGDQNYSSSFQTSFATVRDANAPNILGNQTNPGSGVVYYSNQIYKFNLTVSDDAGISHVILQFNSTNYTASRVSGSASSGNWSANIIDLAANATGYPVIWYANDTSNNWNKSDAWHYNISKNSSVFSQIAVNNTQPELPEYVNLTALSTIDFSINLTVYSNQSGSFAPASWLSFGRTTQNFYLFNASSAGIYNFSANFSGNENYTANSTLQGIIVTVVDTTPPTLSSGFASPTTIRQYDNFSVFVVMSDSSERANATLMIYNSTNSSVFAIQNLTKRASPELFFTAMNVSNITQGTYSVNATLIDIYGNRRNVTLGNLTINSTKAATSYFINDSFVLSGGAQQVINRTAESNTTLSIFYSGASDVSGVVFAIASYAQNPETQTTIPNINKFIELSISQNFTWTLIKIFYNASEIASGYSENNLRIYKLYSNNSWVPFSGTNTGGVNTTDKFVWANTTSFSLFGAFVMPTCFDSIQNQDETGVDCGGVCVDCLSPTTTLGSSGGSSSGGTTTTTTSTTSTTTTLSSTTTTTITTATTSTTISGVNATTTTVDNKSGQGGTGFAWFFVVIAILTAAIYHFREYRPIWVPDKSSKRL